MKVFIDKGAIFLRYLAPPILFWGESCILLHLSDARPDLHTANPDLHRFSKKRDMNEKHKAKRPCFARYSPRTTTTNQQGTKCASNAYMCPRMHNLGANMAVFGPNILSILEGSKFLVPTYQKTIEAPCSYFAQHARPLGSSATHVGWIKQKTKNEAIGQKWPSSAIRQFYGS